MNITFEVEKFCNDPRGLIDVLSSLNSVRAWHVGNHREIEEVVCRTPSSALKYCQMVSHSYGVSRESEKVFVKNPGIGIRYLRIVNRTEFLDEKVQKRFWKKVVKKADLAYEWCRAFGRRLSEAEEEVFVGQGILPASHKGAVPRENPSHARPEELREPRGLGQEVPDGVPAVRRGIL
jgi:hypothetical protein